MATDKKQITRSRTSYSCQTCRRRKVKCDKSHPVCGGCQKVNEACVWGDDEKIAGKRATDDTQNNHEDDARKRRALDESDDNASGLTSVAMKAIELKLNQMTSMVQDLARLTPDSNPDSPRIAGSDLVGHTSNEWVLNSGLVMTSSTLFPPLGRIDFTHKSDELGESYKTILSKLDQLNDALKTGFGKLSAPKETVVDQQHASGHDPTDSSSRPRSSQTGIDFATHLGRVSFGQHENILAPTGEDGNTLFRSWLFSTYPILPLFSPKEVLKKYRAFYDWYMLGMDKGEPDPDPTFTPYLTMIWYTGFVALSQRAKEKWFPWACNGPNFMRALRHRLEDLLDIQKIETAPSLWCLAASLTYQHLALGGQDTITNSIRNTVNIRIAQSLGLHTERTLRILNSCEAETRRRLWWEAISADAALSTVSGMPVIMDEMYTDTKTISELKEASMGTTEAEDYETHLKEANMQPASADDPSTPQHSSLISAYHLVARARHKLTVATKKVLKANMRAQPMTREELTEVRQSILTTSQEVNAMINRIPAKGVPELDFAPLSSCTGEFDCMEGMGDEITEQEMHFFARETDQQSEFTRVARFHKVAASTFHKWARITLSMLVDRLDCISYAPFLKNSKSRLWATARGCALRGCHAYMRKNLSIGEDPDLARFRLAWYSCFQPMHATIILLIDVYDRPHSEEAPRSRAMLDRLLLMGDPQRRGLLSLDSKNAAIPLKEGGREPWTMLRKLRYKAWQKAGLDPDVLWSEEDQMAVGVGKPLGENDLFVRSLREDIISRHKEVGSRDWQMELSRGQASSVTDRQNGKLVLHPSELSPGDQISGSIVRDVDGFHDDVNIPKILLLRARYDQELTPHPCTLSKPEAERNAKVAANAVPNQPPSTQVPEPESLHIGELIKRIKDSRTSNVAQSGPVTAGSTGWESSKDTGQTSWPNCDHRTIHTTEAAAYQDHLDRHSASSNVDNAPTPQFDALQVNDYVTNHTAALRQQSSETPNPSESLSFSASIPPTLANVAFTRSHVAPIIQPRMGGIYSAYQDGSPLRATAEGTLVQQASSSLPDRTQKGVSVYVDTDMDISSADFDFDWEKWDDMFGQFAGLEDLLMLEHESQLPYHGS